MPTPIEWKEADRVESVRTPGATARLVVRRRYHPKGIIEVLDATPADLASALDAIPEGEREAIVKVTEIVGELRIELAEARLERDEIAAELDARTNEADALALRLIAAEQARDTARAERDAAANRAERFSATAEAWCRETIKSDTDRDALRLELRAREWLDATGLTVIGGTVLVDTGASGRVFVGAADGVAFAYATYAAAARALGWEG